MYKIIFTVMGALIGLGTFAQDATTLRKKNFNTPDGIGIKGYDPVAYEGVTYYFSSAANRDAFKMDPGTFKIVDGKLFLFYNQFFTNTLKSWNKDETNLHRQADNNWQKIYH